MAATKKRSSKNFSNIFHIPFWLGILLLTLLLLRIPSLFEPFSYGDEMIYLTLGEGIRQGLVLYKDIHDNKPPLLYFLAAVAGNVFWFRAILAVWMLGTTILFWKLATKLSPKNNRIVQVATVMFGILTTLPLLEGNIANAELFMVGFTILAFMTLLQKKLTTRTLLLGGALFSMAALFKIPAAFDLVVIFAYWLIQLKKRSDILPFVRKCVIVSVGFLIPIVLTLLWYWTRGAFGEYLISAFAQNVGYLSSWRPDDAQKSFLSKNGPLLVRASIVALGVIILWFLRKRVSKLLLISVLWLLLSLFAVTLSERPYPHYLVQSVPAVAILIGILVASERMEQPFVVVPLFLAVFVPVYFKFYYYHTFSYYTRFMQLATGKINTEQYFDKFDENVSRNYKIAQFIHETTLPQQRVFVWGDSPPIYALSRRLPPLKYTATYHINDFSTKEEVLKNLQVTRPELVVILPDSPEFIELSAFLVQNYVALQTVEGSSIWRLMSPQILNAIEQNVK